MKKIKTVTTVLLVIVFFAPMFGAFLSTIGQSADTNQYSGLQGIVMGVYNLPFFIISLVTFLIGNNYSKKGNTNTATTLFTVSIVSSFIGTTVMVLWGLGVFS